MINEYSPKMFEKYRSVLNFPSHSAERSLMNFEHLLDSLFPKATVFSSIQWPLSSGEGKTRYPPKARVSLSDD